MFGALGIEHIDSRPNNLTVLGLLALSSFVRRLCVSVGGGLVFAMLAGQIASHERAGLTRVFSCVRCS